MEPLVRKLFNRNPDISEFLSPLHVSSAPDLDMGRFRAGIDNMHIDVVLSQKFHSALTNLVRKMVQEELSRLGYSDNEKTAENKDIEAFREIYRGLWEAVLEKASKNPALIDQAKLLQITLLKVILGAPGSVIEDLRKRLRKEVELPSRDSGGRSLELHERLVSLAKHEADIRYRTLRRIFKLVQQLEAKELRKLRKSILGISWLLPKALLFNPLLHLPDLNTEAYFLNHYPIVCMDREEEQYFVRTNRIFCELFEDYLADWCQPVTLNASNSPDGQGFQVRQREWQSGMSEFLEGHRMLEQSLQETEFKTCQFSWLDTPNNIDQIFHKPASSSWFSGFNSKDKQTKYEKTSGSWLDFQQRVTNEWLKQLNKSGILRRVAASYRTPRLFRQLNERVSIRDIYRYLAGTLPRRKLVQRLNSAVPAENDEIFRALDTVHSYLQRIPANKQTEYAIRYLKEFLTFRRDLKLAYFAYQQMGYIRLLKNAEDISLSQENGTLYEFRLRSESEPASQAIRAHVVLKADLRGSTEITHELMQKRLNPATHFSLNFFGPITNLLDRFDAHKVFVEGDALILSVLDMGGAGGQSMIVAYACGLACQVLRVMDAQNRQNLNKQLPKLELGLGIAFSDDAPAYLYDDRRKIMISPAINRADRLSSCSAELRKNTGWKRSKRHCVEVMHAGMNGRTDQKVLRFNVNGIELDPPAFARLQKELVLHKVRIASRSGSYHYYYAGRFVDRHGSSNWLVVREAPMKIMTDDHVVIEPQAEVDYFYEVITDASLIESVKTKLRSHANGRK